MRRIIWVSVYWNSTLCQTLCCCFHAFHSFIQMLVL